jgi:hypothetical protein
MKYFLHDTGSFDDEKVSELFMSFGYEGLGLFYTALEKIAKQEKPIKTTVLKAQLKVGKRLEKCWNFMESLGILSSNNGETFNERILSYSETYQIKKEKTKKKVSEWRERQANIESVTGYVPVSNPSKVNKSKVKESKVNNNDLIFPFNSNNFLSVWEVLINQPKWKKKSHDALQASLKKLSNYSEAVAIQMMENTIAGGWQGLFEIKNSNNESGKKGFTRDGVQEALNRRLNELQQTRG